MRLGRAADALAGSGAGLYALCALAAVAGFIVGWTKVGQAVVVSGAHMVDSVGAGEPAPVADVAIFAARSPTAAHQARGSVRIPG
jgi:hypothetical protein